MSDISRRSGVRRLASLLYADCLLLDLTAKCTVYAKRRFCVAGTPTVAEANLEVIRQAIPPGDLVCCITDLMV